MERGEITQAEWHARILAVVEPAYLSATTEQMGSGHSGTREQWEQTRGLIMEAINEHYGQAETQSVDSMLCEFTDTAIEFKDEGELQRIYEMIVEE